MEWRRATRRYKRRFYALLRRHSLIVSYLSIAIVCLTGGCCWWQFSDTPIATNTSNGFNYASPENGAAVISTPETWPMALGYYHIFGYKTAEFTSDPQLALEPGTGMSQGFCYTGQKGTLIIKLARKVVVKTLVVEHQDRDVSPKTLQSAPRDFKIYGSDDNKTYRILTTITFDQFGHSQTFQLKSKDPVTYLKVQVTSNWGREDYTCLYGIRVFGMPA